LLRQGTSLAAARSISWQLLKVIRLLRLTALRDVWIDEIEKAAQRWARQQHVNPLNLPRVERAIACTPERCLCGNCGAETAVIGYEANEVQDVEPTRYCVQVTKLEKKICKTAPSKA
jgi:hypothetical protein